MKAGSLDYRVAFDQLTESPNGQGGTFTGFVERYICWAGFRFLRGGENVQAARLEGRQPVVVTIRACALANSIGTDWRMRDTRSGEVYNIRSIVPSDDRGWVELTVESGVAA